MTGSPLRRGSRVVLARFAESPPAAIETVLSLEPMAPPDPAELGARDVNVAVRCAAVGWVDLLMTSVRDQIAVGDAVIVDACTPTPDDDHRA
jgi:hypothetical protein